MDKGSVSWRKTELSYTYSAYDADDAVAYCSSACSVMNKVGANPKVSIGVLNRRQTLRFAFGRDFLTGRTEMAYTARHTARR